MRARKIGAMAIFLLSTFGRDTAGSREPEMPLAEVPFKLHRNAVILEATVNGSEPLRLLLDTGWGPLALVSSAAERLKLEPEKTDGDYPLVQVESLAIGGAVRRNAKFEVFPAQELEPLIGPHDGVLSTAFFKDLVLQIDYPAGIVRFYSKSPIPTTPPAEPRTRSSVPMVILQRVGALPFTDAVLVDGKPVRALFDTGGAGSFMVMKQLVDRAELEVLPDDGGKVAIGMLSGGHASQTTVQFVRVGRIALGAFGVDSPRVMVAPSGLEGDDWGHDLNIGYGFMRDYIVTFDYPGRAITFELPAAGDHEPR